MLCTTQRQTSNRQSKERQLSRSWEKRATLIDPHNRFSRGVLAKRSASQPVFNSEADARCQLPSNWRPSMWKTSKGLLYNLILFCRPNKCKPTQRMLKSGWHRMADRWCDLRVFPAPTSRAARLFVEQVINQTFFSRLGSPSCHNRKFLGTPQREQLFASCTVIPRSSESL